MNKFCGVGQGNEWEVSGSDKAETEDRRDSLSLLCEVGGGDQSDQDLDVVMLEVRTVKCA